MGRSQRTEMSTARQLATQARLGVPHPRGRVVHATSQLVPAATELIFPLVVKPNVGGSGLLMARFDDRAALDAAVAKGEPEAVFSLDGTAIGQEYHPPRSGSIVRVEVLDGALLYAIRIQAGGAAPFNLCPADGCQALIGGVPELGATSAADSANKPPRIAVTTPPRRLVDAAIDVFAASGIDVGGLAYLESERDRELPVYDVNALSNFVSDAPALLWFDQFARFIDDLERRLERVPLSAARSTAAVATGA